jgi:hypothetical protein
MRKWFYFGDRCITIEWYFGKPSCGFSIDLATGDSDDGIRFYLAIPFLFTLYLVFEGFVPCHWFPGEYRPNSTNGKVYYYTERRCIGVRIHNWIIWVSLWENPHEWSSRDPWWWRFNVDILDLLLGKAKHSAHTIQKGRISIPMPERDYPASYELYDGIWKRPRWWPLVVRRVNIDNDEPIPLPGKGTTSYNCGDDASYSISMVYRGSLEATAKEYAEGIVRDRVKRCGREVYP